MLNSEIQVSKLESNTSIFRGYKDPIFSGAYLLPTIAPKTLNEKKENNGYHQELIYIFLLNDDANLS